MNRTGVARWLPIATIIGIVVISGPFVPMIDFTSASVGHQYTAEGTASIEILSPQSDSARLAAGRFGTGYYFIAPEITLHLRTVHGTPTLIYEIVVPGISQNFAKLVFLAGTDEGRTLTIAIDRMSVPEDKIEGDSFRGDLSLRIRSANDTRTVFRQNITVVVQDTDGNKQSS